MHSFIIWGIQLASNKINYKWIIGFILGPIVFAICASTTLTDPATGKLMNDVAPWAPGAALGLMLWALIWWIAEVVPYGVTALLIAVVGCAFVGLNPKAFGYASTSAGVSAILQTFFSSTIWVFFGGFVLGWGMEYSGLAKRITRKFVGAFAKVSRDAFWTVFAMWTVCWFLSWWMSNTSATAVVYPLMLGLLAASPWINGKQAEVSLIFLAYAASMGGLATIIGTPPNLIGAGFVRSQGLGEITFIDWLKWGIPLAVIGLLVLIIIGKIIFGKAVLDPKVLEEQWKREPLGKMTLEEKWYLVVFIITVFLWIFRGAADAAGWTAVTAILPDDAVPAIICAILLFGAPRSLRPYKPIFNWKEGLKGIDWDTLFLFAGGLAFGTLLFNSKGGLWIGKQLVPYFGVGAAGIIMGSAFVAWLLTQFTSNTSTANAICPIAIALGKAAGLPTPAIVSATLAAAISASYAFILPISTPPNAIVYGAGRVRVSRMILYGLIVSIITVPILFGLLRIFFAF